ncbi:MAG: hypothetical protein RL624_371 [Bacteroidota bacterium]|jgi:hypothetical protein
MKLDFNSLNHIETIAAPSGLLNKINSRIQQKEAKRNKLQKWTLSVICIFLMSTSLIIAKNKINKRPNITNYLNAFDTNTSLY